MPQQPGLKPIFRAEHIGSLLRPTELRTAFRQLSAGKISQEEFVEIQNKAVRDVVAMQERIGLPCVTDGEFRRTSYWSHVVEAVDGLGVAPARFKFRDDAGNQTEFLSPHIESRIKRARSFSSLEAGFLLSATNGAAKVTMPSPSTMHFWNDNQYLMRGVYPDASEYFRDLTQVYQEEIAILTRLGVRYIQLDEVPLAMLCDQSIRQSLAEGGEDPEALVGAYIELLNDCVRNRGDEVKIGVHLCRGNFKGLWLTQGGYDHVAQRMFSEVDADVFLLEYDTPRAGGFAPLRHVPQEKLVVLGLISSKAPRLEDVDGLRRRIDQAAKFIPLEQLAISPQCGFASAVTANPVTYEDQVAKLRLVNETADLVWG